MNKHLYVSYINTILGQMVAIADDKFLYLLEFVNRKNLEQKIENLKIRTKLQVVEGISAPIELLKLELEQYFKGQLNTFKTPLFLFGSTFQQAVWNALRDIPHGITCSYLDIAKKIDNPKAFRAVANTNGKNPICIVIPCHRVINTNGKLGGYSSGIDRKKWLLNHEKQNIHLLS